MMEKQQIKSMMVVDKESGVLSMVLPSGFEGKYVVVNEDFTGRLEADYYDSEELKKFFNFNESDFGGIEKLF